MFLKIVMWVCATSLKGPNFGNTKDFNFINRDTESKLFKQSELVTPAMTVHPLKCITAMLGLINIEK